MADLLRYIEQQFTVPAPVDAIELMNDSRLQTRLQRAASGKNAGAAVRELAGAFVSSTFPTPVADPLSNSDQYQAFGTQLRGMENPTEAGIEKLVETVLGAGAADLVGTDQFRSDKELLQNSVLAVKITTGFAQADAARLVQWLRVIAFVEKVAAGLPADLTQASVWALFDRPVRVPANLLIGVNPPRPGPGDSQEATGDQQLLDLAERTSKLKATYSSLMTLQPGHLEVHVLQRAADEIPVGRVKRKNVDPPANEQAQPDASAVISIVRMSAQARDALPKEQRRVLDSLPLDVANAPLADVVAEVKRQWIEANQQLLPATVPGPSKVYRVGQHIFAQPDIPIMHTMSGPGPAPAPAPAPDFSKAIARPVGVGNLQLVRQELIGYETSEISHIENVLEGELLKRETRRTELTELTLTEELTTSQSQERDQQSTERNELSSETQNEAGQQSSSSSGSTTSSAYGKLVENSKSNYAQSTVQRAVESLTSTVRQQRVQRERKTFVEDAVHELDNTKGNAKVRGIYQWVDKKFSMRVLNYGKRLMYDVVVPEPAAFLTQSLKDAVQPESFQLSKPADFTLYPDELDASNYMYYATTYGVTGSVTPPPEDFVQTVALVEHQDVQSELNAFGSKYHGRFYSAYKIHIPESYKAVSGYFQHTNPTAASNGGRLFEFMVGDDYGQRDEWNDPWNFTFTMNGETGDIPITVSTATDIFQFNFAFGINCQRTDQALAQWQLKTHAAITSGYQRQLADYQDKLNRYVAAVRSQLALSANYAHDPTIEHEELKKAFIFLLLGEHFSAYQATPTPAPMPSPISPPDPTYVKQWGAMVAFFERAFEWENLMYLFYPYFWGRPDRWEELVLTQDTDPEFEAFLKAGAARVVVPARPGFEAALAHYQETGDVWLGEEIPDMFSDMYVSIISEIKAANSAPGDEVCVDQWEVTLPTTLVMLKDDDTLPTWKPTPCNPPPGP